MAKNIEIGGRLHSIATGNIVAGADEILDDKIGKKQSEVNQDVNNELGGRYTKSETYSKEELNNLITTPDVKFVTVEATTLTLSATDLLPSSGASNTIYRVANWDGVQYVTTCYSEYAWDGTKYVKLDTKDYGIDNEPVAGSENLVKSGGVANQLEKISEVSKIPAESESQEISVLDDENSEILFISKDGVNARNLKSNSKDVVTLDTLVFYATTEELNTKQDVIEEIEEETIDDDSEEVIIGKNGGSEDYVKIGNYGIKAKEYYDLEGNKINLGGGILQFDSSLNRFTFYSKVNGTDKVFSFIVSHEIDNDDLVYLNEWRLLEAYFVGQNQANDMLVLDAGENEMAFKVQGASDFTGGYHGDERIDIDNSCFVKFFADGRLITETEMLSDFQIRCERFEYFQLSTLHETSQIIGQYVIGHPIVAYHYKHTVLENGSAVIENKIFVEQSLIIESFFSGLACIGKNAASNAIMNADVKQFTGDGSQIPVGDNIETDIYFYNNTNNISCLVNSYFIQGFTDLRAADRFYVWDRDGDSKYYRLKYGVYKKQQGDILQSKCSIRYY